MRIFHRNLAAISHAGCQRRPDVVENDDENRARSFIQWLGRLS